MQYQHWMAFFMPNAFDAQCDAIELCLLSRLLTPLSRFQDCNEKLFSISKFFEKNGRPQCRNCKSKKGPKCSGCGKEVVEQDHVVYFGLHFLSKELHEVFRLQKSCRRGLLL
jgi:hypothetical protein